MAGFFDDEPDPADIEDYYIQRVIPDEGIVLWLRSVEESPVWDSMSPTEHMTAADKFAGAAWSGSIYEAEDFTDYLNIEWDDADIGEFWDLYDQLAG